MNFERNFHTFFRNILSFYSRFSFCSFHCRVTGRERERGVGRQFSTSVRYFSISTCTRTHTQTHTQTFCTVSLARFSTTMHFHYTCAGTRRRHFRQRQRRLKVFSLISVQFCFVLFTFLFAFLFATFYRIACQRQATGKRVTCNVQRATGQPVSN